MSRSWQNILRLGLKELFSLRRDVVMLVLIVYTFSFAVYIPARHAQTELRNGSVAIVDNDRSRLSRRIGDSLLSPYFQSPVLIDQDQIDSLMDAGDYTFIIDFPPRLQADLLAGRTPTVQVNIDATAITQAAQGASYLQQVASREAENFLAAGGEESGALVSVSAGVKFNPNLENTWFMGVNQFINMITVMAIILTGAALMRERERGTVEHLLVLPVTPLEIMAAKVGANGLMITVVAMLSLKFIVQGVLEIPIAGSIFLFVLGMIVYLFSVTSLGVVLATVARSMPQLGLLAFPVFMVMILLSGGMTPVESMPTWLQQIMLLSPSRHFVSFAQAILFRGASFAIVWPHFAIIAGLGAVFFVIAWARFRRAISLTR